MVFLFRVFAFVVLLFLLRYLFASLIAHAKVVLFGRPQRAEPQNEIIAGRAHKDPQCGTYVAEELAIKASVAGKSYYFCSPECRDRFFQR
jgi:YHS domain-containing protein